MSHRGNRGGAARGRGGWQPHPLRGGSGPQPKGPPTKKLAMSLEQRAEENFFEDDEDEALNRSAPTHAEPVAVLNSLFILSVSFSIGSR